MVMEKPLYFNITGTAAISPIPLKTPVLNLGKTQKGTRFVPPEIKLYYPATPSQLNSWFSSKRAIQIFHGLIH
jgi:hypothetical protein